MAKIVILSLALIILYLQLVVAITDFRVSTVVSKLSSAAESIAQCENGFIYFYQQCTIQQIDLTGTISVYAGTPGTCKFSEDGLDATYSPLYTYDGDMICVNNTLYFAGGDSGSCLRTIHPTTKLLSTIAGQCSEAPTDNENDGDAKLATFQSGTYLHYVFFNNAFWISNDDTIRRLYYNKTAHTYYIETFAASLANTDRGFGGNYKNANFQSSLVTLRSNGDIVFYDQSSNSLPIITLSNSIISYFVGGKGSIDFNSKSQGVAANSINFGAYNAIGPFGFQLECITFHPLHKLNQN